MAESDPIPSVFELDWFGDLTLYQHPPCMFLLWYLTMGATKAYKIIKDLLGGGGSGDDGSEGGEEKGEGGEKKGEGSKDGTGKEGGKDETEKEGDKNDDGEDGGEEEAGKEEGENEAGEEEAPEGERVTSGPSPEDEEAT